MSTSKEPLDVRFLEIESCIQRGQQKLFDIALPIHIFISYLRELMRKVVKRAENAGYEALVLTVDANVFGIRYADEKNGFDLPPHLT